MTALPYLPDGREILYVPENDKFMQAAKKVATDFSYDKAHPTGAVLVRDGEILGRGANGSKFHVIPGCVRKLFRVATGQKYWLCPGCSPKHHAEAKALRRVKINGNTAQGADLYLWGHWWCCPPCWQKMIDADVYRVFLVEGADKKFK